MNHRLLVLLIIAGLVGTSSPDGGSCEADESFEAPGVSWRLGHTDCRPLQIVRHERRFEGAHGGQGCEYLELSAGTGTAVHLVHAITPAPLIAELVPSLWVRSERPGLQLLTRVVFPRSRTKDGKPITALLPGDFYTEAGSWRQLRVDNLSQKLRREVWSLRSRPEITVDEREAYIDLLVLNVYAGAGTNSVWIDDLVVSGLATTGQTAEARRDEGWPESTREEAPQVVDKVTTGLQGNVLLGDGRPLFVRAIEHNGETFAYLQSLGFNAIRLALPPTEVQLEEARRAGVWLIAPPPLTGSGIEIRDEHGPVLAWYVGEALTTQDLDRVTSLHRDITLAEIQRHRPILLHVASGFSQFRFANGVFLLERPVLGTSFQLADYGAWLAQAARHGRIGAPFWAVISTELSVDLLDQMARLGRVSRVDIVPEPEQVRELAFEALARGARGLIFRSRTRLDVRDRSTRLRSAMLDALNRELELIAPWVAAGLAAGETGTSTPRVRVYPLQTDRARLLLASRIASEQQFTSAPLTSQPLAFTVDGTPLSDQAYAVAAHGAVPLPVQRGSGLRVTLDSPESISMVLLTQDPLAINYVGRISAEIRGAYAARQMEVAELLLEETEAVDQYIASRRSVSHRPDHWPVQAHADLRQAARLIESGDARHAIQLLVRSTDQLRQVRRAHWETAVLSFPSPISSPLCATFASLPLHYDTSERLARSPWSVDVLAAGEMESLEHLINSGWKQNRAGADNVSVDVRLSVEGSHSGRSCLQLRTWENGDETIGTDGQWPVTITSPPLPVRAGQLVRIHGWVNLPRRLSATADGLMIFDSQSGTTLAERIVETKGWQEFLLYRAVKSDDDFQLVFAHTGIGESWLDEISVMVTDP